MSGIRLFSSISFNLFSFLYSSVPNKSRRYTTGKAVAQAMKIKAVTLKTGCSDMLLQYRCYKPSDFVYFCIICV